MRQHEEQLWQDLADHRGIRMRAPNPQASASFNGVLTEPASTGNVEEPRPAAVAPPSSGRGRGGQRAAATKSPSHLGN
jgi:hypothetical protein